ncbi:AAA family ATPase [soil metagenome]
MIVCGPSGGGKSSVAGPLSEHLGVPLISKDELKEVLFDSLGWGDRERSRQLSNAAYDLMYHLAGRHLEAGRSCILEANFRPEAAVRLAALAESTPFNTVTVRCHADPDVLRERLTRRAEERLRHPGHLDAALRAEVESLIEGGSPVLGGPVVEVDTTDPAGVEIEGIARRVRDLINREQKKGP